MNAIAVRIRGAPARGEPSLHVGNRTLDRVRQRHIVKSRLRATGYGQRWACPSSGRSPKPEARSPDSRFVVLVRWECPHQGEPLLEKRNDPHPVERVATRLGLRRRELLFERPLLRGERVGRRGRRSGTLLGGGLLALE